jgi:FdhE protein
MAGVSLGEFAEPPFVRLPEPPALFRGRAERFRALAGDHALAPYLTFLAEIGSIQERLAAGFRPSPPVVAADYEIAPLARERFTVDTSVMEVGDQLLTAVADLEMPATARVAVTTLRSAPLPDRRATFQRVLEDPLPDNVIAEHSFVSAALQVVFTGIAAAIPADVLHPSPTGGCPVCASPPVATLIVGWPRASGTRYCACGLCGTLWNYVRIKCTLCGSTGGIMYQGIEGDDGTIKAETCDSCKRYVKIMQQVRRPELEPLADDVASLGLDILMRDKEFFRGAANPFLLGY